MRCLIRADKLDFRDTHAHTRAIVFEQARPEQSCYGIMYGNSFATSLLIDRCESHPSHPNNFKGIDFYL